jgi:hypothetical protein
LGTSLDLDVIADATGESRLRFNVGMLDEASLIAALYNYIGLCQSFFNVAQNHPTADEHIVLPVRVDAHSVGFKRGIYVRDGGQLFPSYREL